MLLPSGVPAQEAILSPTGTAEVERVVVTGSNIPTAEEVGPNPVDTYRPADIEKLGIRNATDLQTFLPQEAGGTLNLNMGNGDGTVQINLRGTLPHRTLVLIDGKRVAFGSLAGAGSSQGEDINLIPFPMIDHIDIPQGWRLGRVWFRRDRGRGQLLLDPQVSWPGNWRDVREHKLGSIQRHGRVGSMVESRYWR